MAFLPKPELLISQDQIRRRISRLGLDIGQAYQDKISTGQPLTVIIVQKGAVIFAADLVRQIRCTPRSRAILPIDLRFIRVSSYHGKMRQAGKPKLYDVLTEAVRGRHILIVDDILDTGDTLAALVAHFAKLEPASLATVVLLKKRVKRRQAIKANYVGFVIPKKFVIGYGLDYQEKYRQLPAIYVVKNGKPPF